MVWQPCKLLYTCYCYCLPRYGMLETVGSLSLPEHQRPPTYGKQVLWDVAFSSVAMCSPPPRCLLVVALVNHRQLVPGTERHLIGTAGIVVSNCVHSAVVCQSQHLHCFCNTKHFTKDTATDRLTVKLLHPTPHNTQGISETPYPDTVSWHGTGEPNTTILDKNIVI